MSAPHKTETAASVPAGMKELTFMGYMEVNGPLWGRIDDDGLPVMGFRVEARHCNPMQTCHGGMLMTFADMLLGFTVSVAVGGKKFLPTVSLSGDYVGPAPLGSWVEGKGRLIRATRSLGFAEALITADGAAAVRTSGIMKIPSQETRDSDVLRLFR
ncbi:PaaI family thioesterase [Ferrovibrio xuzhouensis]|uniref:PaaI family thioesterase n=1 Tax=Ferrovibrio xuzhouensis TaxID=1576914 RepID=A0ABV7VGN4_9PROT